MNILYLDDYINYYSKKINEIIKIKPYKKTLRNGYIIDRFKFIKAFNKFIVSKHIKPSLINESITVIINNYATEEDKSLLKETLNELNYKKVLFVNETELLKVNKNKLYINCNNTYFYLMYINIYGNTKLDLYNNNELNILIIKLILKKYKFNTIILYGKNVKKLKNDLEKETIDYYYYEETDNLLIKLLLNEKNM